MRARRTPSRRRRLWLVAASVAWLAGCSSNPKAINGTGVGGNLSEAVGKVGTKVIGGPLIPDTNLQLGPTVAYPLEKLVYWGLWAGAAWLVLDPLAPNWEIEETRLPEDHVHFRLVMKRFYTGGAGEARWVLDQRARRLAREAGYRGFEVVEYAEALDSALLGARRTASGVIRLKRDAG